MKTLTNCLCLILLSAAIAMLPMTALAEEKQPAEQTNNQVEPKKVEQNSWQDHVSLGFEFLTLFVYRNDADFDRTDANYEYGQDVGLIGTYLKPAIDVQVVEQLRLHWDMEVGLDLWSRNDPEVGLGQSDGSHGASLSLKQRELYADICYEGFFARLGYQHLQDVSGLFINHWIGAADLGFRFDGGHSIRAFVGQLPDQTYEGWRIEDNNFKNDVFVYGADGVYTFSEIGSFKLGAYGLHDGSVRGKDRDIGALAAAVALGKDSWDATLSLIGQYGQLEKGAADGTDATLLAYGLSVDGGYRIEWFSFRLSGAVLSADDDELGNDSLAFVWSGKRPGVSILLSENELRDLGDNLDERASVYDGFFHNTLAGLGGADLGLYFHPLDSLTLGIVSAGLWTLNSERALGGELIALEEELSLVYTAFNEKLELQLTGGLLIPGKAGAAFVNAIDKTETEIVGFVQVGVLLRF